MRVTSFLLALSLGVSIAARGGSSPAETRDGALRHIEACLRRNEASSRECKGFNKHIQTLIKVYWQGDKIVLPTLLQFPYLTDFYGDALIADPDGFLTAVSHLSENGQHAAATGIAGGMFGLKQPRFEAIRTTLMNVTEASPNFQLARTCLLTLETENASFLVTYFPPEPFTGRSSDFQIHWFSRELYALGQKPLWPPEPGYQRIYRVTVLPAFLPPECVILTTTPDDMGEIKFRTTDSSRQRLSADGPRMISRQQLADFTEALKDIQFWQLPPELPPDPRHVVLDKTEWILEGVQNGSYHIIVRECPGKTSFAEAAGKLFDLSGQKSYGGC